MRCYSELICLLLYYSFYYGYLIVTSNFVKYQPKILIFLHIFKIDGARKFATNGMILVLTRPENYQCFYFDCCYLSAFDDESECFFFGGDSILKIKTIKHAKEVWTNYLYELQAINLILRMINESAACLREGVVADSDLLDAGMVFGSGRHACLT